MHPALEMHGLEPIVLTAYFAASSARLFKAWTDPATILKWFGKSPISFQSADIDLRVGGRWRFVKSSDLLQTVALGGRYLEIEENRHLKFTWQYVTTNSNGMSDEKLHAEIDVTFAPKGKGTDVRLRHSPLRHEDSRAGIDQKWSAAFNDLRAVI